MNNSVYIRNFLSVALIPTLSSTQASSSLISTCRVRGGPPRNRFNLGRNICQRLGLKMASVNNLILQLFSWILVFRFASLSISLASTELQVLTPSLEGRLPSWHCFQEIVAQALACLPVSLATCWPGSHSWHYPPRPSLVNHLPYKKSHRPHSNVSIWPGLTRSISSEGGNACI